MPLSTWASRGDAPSTLQRFYASIYIFLFELNCKTVLPGLAALLATHACNYHGRLFLPRDWLTLCSLMTLMQTLTADHVSS